MAKDATVEANDAAADATTDSPTVNEGGVPDAGDDAPETPDAATSDGSALVDGAICTAGEGYCDQHTLVQCNADGTQWDTYECPSVSHCMTALSSTPSDCLPMVCCVTARRCDGKTVMECNPEQDGWHVAETCPDQCVDGACWSPTPCNPGDRRCGGSTGHSPELCTSAGQWATDAPCSGGTVCTAGECVTPPSCLGLAQDCGPNSDQSCCAANLVQGGVSPLHYDPAAMLTMWPMAVSSFNLDVYEVTVGRFRKFVETGGGTHANPPAKEAGAHPKVPGSGWHDGWNALLPVDTADMMQELDCGLDSTWTDQPGPNETKPVNCVSWHVALAFCAWDGGRLPTLPEWVRAAGGGSELRTLPWSEPPASRRLSDDHAVYCGTTCSGPQRVGSRSPPGDALWGHADMAGNVAEWTQNSPSDSLLGCVDCAGTSDDEYHLYRGGSYESKDWYSLTVQKQATTNWPGLTKIGFRCARTAQP